MIRALLTAVVAVVLTAGPAAAAAFTPGPSGLGDPFFPLAGNAGYDVTNYSLQLDYEPATDVLAGQAIVTATATQDLSRFDLDLRGFAISRLTVDGVAASFTRDGQELVITPPVGIRSGTTFRVAVDYLGVPEVITDPDSSIEGWIPTDDGAFVVGEPQGSPGWYPCNDNPRDKATFDFAVTVPQGLTALGKRRPRLIDDPRRANHVGLAGGRPDVDVPGDLDARAVRPHSVDAPERAARLCRRRPAARQGPGAEEAA